MSKELDKSFAAAASSRYPNYLEDRDICKKFFLEYRDVDANPKYVTMISEIANRKRKIFTLYLDDLDQFKQLHLAQRIQMNIVGYCEELFRVLDDLIEKKDFKDDVIDHLAAEARVMGQELPPLLTRRYELVVFPLKNASDALPLRALKGGTIGTLTVLRGICISTTAVRPKLCMHVSVCEVCAEKTFQQVTGERVTPLEICQSQQCKLNNTSGHLLPQHSACKFVEYQELRIQELPQDVPRGSIPRTIRVVCEGEQTKIATPGQVVRIIGTYVPAPSTEQGHEVFRASTMVRTLYRALWIELEKRSYTSLAAQLQDQINEIRRYPDRQAVIEKLTRSVAPEIWGLENLKKALLCLLVGGSSVANGMRVRSDLNICIMGDPGVAKSQLLKWVASVAPRSVFTTGKGSSGVGLTASVTRDAHTGEIVLEGGALVLSDKGICCIDEFDKMDDSDRTALHEVMEQQIVSIAKAGIITTLNARTSILAASNPKYSRWRRNLPPSENVNLPPALLSRFDLLWLLLDESNRERDAELSMHVTHVHLHGEAPGIISDAGINGSSLEHFGKDFLKAYIGEAKKIHPYVDEAAARAIKNIYCEMRSQAVRQSNVVTARALFTLIRLSQACARLRFSEYVQEMDVLEAGRLLDCSKASLQDSTPTDSHRQIFTSDAAIFTIIKELANGSHEVKLSTVRPVLTVKGISESNLLSCLATYADAGVWTFNEDSIVFAT